VLQINYTNAATMTHDHKRHDTSTLFAALNVFSGEVIGECKRRHRHQELLAFLKTVAKQTQPGKELHVIVDNDSTHKHQKVKNWLKRNKRVTLHFIPTSSSWLNLGQHIKQKLDLPFVGFIHDQPPALWVRLFDTAKHIPHL